MAFRLRKAPRLTGKHDAYPYQLDALLAIKELSYAAIFHEQGLGKTKIAIDLLLYWLGNDIVDTVFVVTKKTLVQNWCDEIANHSFVTPRVLSGNRRSNSVALNSPVLIYVLNYEVISTNYDLIEHFLATCRVGAILDESQKIKNPESKLTQCFLTLSEKFERRIIATGTPAANRPYDIWSQIRFLDSGESLGDNFDLFRAELDLPEYDRTVDEFANQLVGVMSRIRSFTVRETKETAGIELPEKVIKTVFVNLADNQRDIYTAYRDQLAYELRTEEGVVLDDAEAILKRLLRLVQCASNPALVDEGYMGRPGKFHALTELLDEIDVSSHKVIVWTSFVENTIWLQSQTIEFQPEVVHGSLSVAERNKSIARFKNDNACRMLIATPGAAKEGLTLTVANHVVFYDRSFSLDDYLQAQDRIHRISQKRRCYVHNLIASNTIDEWVDALLNAKHQAAQLVQGDVSIEEFNSEFNADLSEILSSVLMPQDIEVSERQERQ